MTRRCIAIRATVREPIVLLPYLSSPAAVGFCQYAEALRLAEPNAEGKEEARDRDQSLQPHDHTRQRRGQTATPLVLSRAFPALTQVTSALQRSPSSKPLITAVAASTTAALDMQGGNVRQCGIGGGDDDQLTTATANQRAAAGVSIRRKSST